MLVEALTDSDGQALCGAGLIMYVPFEEPMSRILCARMSDKKDTIRAHVRWDAKIAHLMWVR